PAIGEVGFFTQFADNDRTFGTGIFGDLANRCFNRPSHDLDADTLIVVRDRKALERLNGTQESDTATRENAFLYRGAGRMQRIVDAVLFLLHFDFRRATDADDGNAPGKLGKTFL